jgi:hypothetical protein
VDNRLLIVIWAGFLLGTIVTACRSRNHLLLFVQLVLLGLVMAAIVYFWPRLNGTQSLESDIVFMIMCWYAWLTNVGAALLIVMARLLIRWAESKWGPEDSSI